jgi:glycosyltransferase involved in cell wall biosynthesis
MNEMNTQRINIKILTLTQAMSGRLSKEEQHRRESLNEWPRMSLYETVVNSEMLNEEFIRSTPKFRRFVYSRFPMKVAQVVEAFILRKRYDAVVSWAENLGIPFAALLKITGTRVPHVGIFSWISRPKKAIPLRLLQSHFDRLILMSSTQGKFATEVLGIPVEKISLLRWPVDLKFWREVEVVDQNMICSVGREMRDYETLIAAMKGLDIRCHIAAGGIGTVEKKDSWIRNASNSNGVPSHVTFGRLPYPELRHLYAQSKFVVIPLMPTETDNGTTSILEAMAMGRAVICSKTEGQRDVLLDGKTGIFVPPQDPAALRNAIEHLLSHPEVAEQMGREGRRLVEARHSLDDYIQSIRKILEDVVSNSLDRQGDTKYVIELEQDSLISKLSTNKKTSNSQ